MVLPWFIQLDEVGDVIWTQFALTQSRWREGLWFGSEPRSRYKKKNLQVISVCLINSGLTEWASRQIQRFRGARGFFLFFFLTWFLSSELKKKIQLYLSNWDIKTYRYHLFFHTNYLRIKGPNIKCLEISFDAGGKRRWQIGPETNGSWLLFWMEPNVSVGTG